MNNPLLRYLTNMDARAARALIVSVVLFLSVALIFVMGRTTAIFDEDDAPIFNWLRESADSPWALPATILVFTAAAFVGAPQMVLIAGAVVAFGPVRGSIFSWIATMISAVVNFELARLFGARLLRRYGGEAVNRLSRVVGRSGFWSSLAVRVVPSAPFIVVNMAAGVSHMRRSAFIAGTGLGIIAKIVLVAFLGGSIMTLADGGEITLALALGGLALGWLVAVIWARRALRSRAPAASPAEAESGGTREDEGMTTRER
jgi:uncharacterized membrane protein YdjX (TVP38/TMEM64 family)